MKKVNKTILIIIGTYLLLLITSVFLEVIFRNKMENKYNEELGYKKCDWDYSESFQDKNTNKTTYTCDVSGEGKFVLFDKTENKTPRCFWRYTPLFKNFVLTQYGTMHRDGIKFEQNDFVMEKVIEKQGCNDKTYYLLTPKHEGELKIESTGTFNYYSDFKINYIK